MIPITEGSRLRSDEPPYWRTTGGWKAFHFIIRSEGLSRFVPAKIWANLMEKTIGNFSANAAISKERLGKADSTAKGEKVILR